jgi:FkbM family methyltransferase
MTDFAVRLVRRLATTPGFRNLTRFEALLRISYSLRSSLVRERRRFVANELRRRPATGVYRLRESGVAFALRHHTGDVMVLDEIFSQREYEPPPRLAEALARLSSTPRVLDLGANIGLFGVWTLGRFPAATIVAVEADPENAAVHRQTIEANGGGDRWQLVEAFASTTPGTVRFAGGAQATSRAARLEEIAAEVPTVDVLPYLADADFAKIDIEGAEWALLADPRFAESCPAIVVLEYHDAGLSDRDPAEKAAQALRTAGHEVVHAGRKPRFGAGLVWSFAPVATDEGAVGRPRA